MSNETELKAIKDELANISKHLEAIVNLKAIRMVELLAPSGNEDKVNPLTPEFTKKYIKLAYKNYRGK